MVASRQGRPITPRQRNLKRANITAFAINVAATIAVAQFEARHQDVWSRLMGDPPAEVAAPAEAETAVRLFVHLRLLDADYARALVQVRSDLLPVQVLTSSGPATLQLQQ